MPSVANLGSHPKSCQQRGPGWAASRLAGGFRSDLRVILGTASLLSVFGLRVISRLGDRILTPILPLFVQQLLPTGSKVASVTGLIIGASALTSAIGAIVLGRTSDRIGARPVLLFCSFVAAGFYAIQYWVTDATQLLLLQALTGFALGGMLTSLSALLVKLSPEGRQGVVFGLDASAMSIANFLGPLLGASIAVGFGLEPCFLFAAAVFVLTGIAVAKFVPVLGSPPAPIPQRGRD